MKLVLNTSNYSLNLISIGMKLNAFLLTMTMLAGICRAEESKSPATKAPKALFVGIVQFVDGDVKWTQRKKYDVKEKITFKTQLHHGDSIRIKKGGMLKFITSERCVVVLYGPARLNAPISHDSSQWQLPKGNSRWICQSNQKLNLTINTHPIEIKLGEVFYYKRKLLILAATVKGSKNLLQPKAIYKWSQTEKAWTLQKKISSSPLALWKFNGKRRAPRESIEISKPKPPPTAKPTKKTPKEKPTITSRWIMGPIFGGGKLSHSTSTFDLDDMDTEGFRLMFHYKWPGKTWSLIGSLNFSEGETAGDNNDDSQTNADPFTGNNEPSGAQNFNRLEGFVADIGWRRNHINSNSLFLSIGVGEETYRINQFFEDNGNGDTSSVHEAVKYMTTKLTVGYDWLVWAKPENWFGFYASAEIYYSQSLFKTNRSDSSNNDFGSPSRFTDAQIEGGYKVFGIMFYLGPLLQF